MADLQKPQDIQHSRQRADEVATASGARLAGLEQGSSF